MGMKFRLYQKTSERKVLIDMQTKIIKVGTGHTDLTEAADVIRGGGLVAFPTETVYGLGADACNPQAAKKIYTAKGRPSDNPLIVHIAQWNDLFAVAGEVPAEAKRLADAFWPGPLTMVMKKNERIPRETTGGLDTVAVRMPNHPAALALICQSGCPIAAPSANTSGRPSPTEAAHVAADLAGKIPVILDGGPVGIGIESTIIDLTEETPVILRPGYITKEMLSQTLLREVAIDSAVIAPESGKIPKAPGMKYRHYAPRAEMIVVSGEMQKVVAKINELTDKNHANGRKTGVIATDETKQFYRADQIESIGAREDEDAIARHLYRILRDFDTGDVQIIYSESFATPRIGQAIMNRLLKAAGNHEIFVS